MSASSSVECVGRTHCGALLASTANSRSWESRHRRRLYRGTWCGIGSHRRRRGGRSSTTTSAASSQRFLCGANGHVRRSVRLHRAAPRTAAHRALWRPILPRGCECLPHVEVKFLRATRQLLMFAGTAKNFRSWGRADEIRCARVRRLLATVDKHFDDLGAAGRRRGGEFRRLDVVLTAARQACLGRALSLLNIPSAAGFLAFWRIGVNLGHVQYPRVSAPDGINRRHRPRRGHQAAARRSGEDHGAGRRSGPEPRRAAETRGQAGA